jgi:chromosome segregation ATPase
MQSKKLLFLLGFVTFLGMGLTALQASNGGQEPNTQNLPDFPESAMSKTEINYLENKISDVDRRLRQLEDEIQFLDERTRSLDRSVKDLRRR